MKKAFGVFVILCLFFAACNEDKDAQTMSLISRINAGVEYIYSCSEVDFDGMLNNPDLIGTDGKIKGTVKAIMDTSFFDSPNWLIVIATSTDSDGKLSDEIYANYYETPTFKEDTLVTVYGIVEKPIFVDLLDSYVPSIEAKIIVEE